MVRGRKVGLSKKVKKTESVSNPIATLSPASRCSTPVPQTTPSEESESTVVDSPKNPIVMELTHEAEIMSTDAPDTVSSDLNSSDSEYDPNDDSLSVNSINNEPRKKKNQIPTCNNQ